jgi:hypothetical protein
MDEFAPDAFKNIQAFVNSAWHNQWLSTFLMLEVWSSTYNKSWAATMEKVSESQHWQSTINFQQPTPDKQEPTIVTDRDMYRKSTVNTRKTTPDNKQLPPTATPDN